jgi:hypothetical protein
VLVLGDRRRLPGAGEDAFGAGVQDALDAGPERFFQHVDGAEVVDLVEVAALLRPQVRIGGEVINLSATTNGSRHRRPITDVRRDDLDIFQWQMGQRCTGTFENMNRLAPLQQAANEMTADEAGSAGDEDGFAAVVHRLPWVSPELRARGELRRLLLRAAFRLVLLGFLV